MSEERANGDSLHWLVRIILRRICFWLVKQGPLHQKRITAYYRIMREEAKREFYEDNQPTFDGFLEECFQDANTKLSFGAKRNKLGRLVGRSEGRTNETTVQRV